MLLCHETAFRSCSRLFTDCHRVEEIKSIVEDDGRALSAETEQLRAKIDFEVRPNLVA